MRSATAIPDDGILAEESGHHRRRNREPFAGRTWVVDPLDGTVNYANGIPYFCVSMALVDADGPLLGVILDPQRDDLYARRAAARPPSTASRCAPPRRSS